MRVGGFVTEAESNIDLAELSYGEYEHFRILRSMLNALTAVDSGTLDFWKGAFSGVKGVRWLELELQADRCLLLSGGSLSALSYEYDSSSL